MWFVRLCRFNHIRRLSGGRGRRRRQKVLGRSSLRTRTSPRLTSPVPEVTVCPRGGIQRWKCNTHRQTHPERGCYTSEDQEIQRTPGHNFWWCGNGALILNMVQPSTAVGVSGQCTDGTVIKPSIKMIIDLILSLLFFFHNNTFYCNVPF